LLSVLRRAVLAAAGADISHLKFIQRKIKNGIDFIAVFSISASRNFSRHCGCSQ